MFSETFSLRKSSKHCHFLQYLLAQIASPGFFQPPWSWWGKKGLCIFDNLFSRPNFEAKHKIIKILCELAQSCIYTKYCPERRHLALIKEERACHVKKTQLLWYPQVHLHCHLAQGSTGITLSALGRAETQSSLQKKLQDIGKPKFQARLVRWQSHWPSYESCPLPSCRHLLDALFLLAHSLSNQ